MPDGEGEGERDEGAEDGGVGETDIPEARAGKERSRPGLTVAVEGWSWSRESSLRAPSEEGGGGGGGGGGDGGGGT